MSFFETKDLLFETDSIEGWSIECVVELIKGQKGMNVFASEEITKAWFVGFG